MHPACGWIHSPDAHNCHCFAKNELVESLGQKRLVQRGRGRALEAVPQRGRECRILEREKKSLKFSENLRFAQHSNNMLMLVNPGADFSLTRGS